MNKVLITIAGTIWFLSCASNPPDVYDSLCNGEPDFYINTDVEDSSRVVTDFDTPPKIIPGENPRIYYPEPARRAGINGSVKVELIISKFDALLELKVLSGPGYCTEQEVIRAFKDASYESATKDGKPVKTKLEQSIGFNLGTK